MVFSAHDYLMGTQVQQQVSGISGEEIVKAAAAEIQRLEKLFSVYLPGSDIQLLNCNAGNELVAVSSDTYNLLTLSLEYSSLSNGAFDITLAPLILLWEKAAAEGRPPSAETIEALLPLVDYHNLKLFPQSKAYLSCEGQALNVGGIGKGYTADRVCELYREMKVSSACINFGGNVVVLGAKEDGSPWKVGIRNPGKDPSDCLAYLEVTDCSVVTSGYYERFFYYNGQLFHHLLNPATGYPVKNNLASVSIISPTSVEADALATAAFVLGLDDGMALVNKIPGTEAVFIDMKNAIHSTEGLRGRLFKIS